MTAFALPRFKDSSLWQQAMTHSSFANEQMQVSQPVVEQPVVEHNERLEFLGDAILTFVSGSYLYRRYPMYPEGELTPIRAALVDQPQLCRFAQMLELGQQLRLGKGAEQEGARQSARLLCSAFEAMIGAYFLDCYQDVQAVVSYVEPLFDTVVEQAVQQGINAKSELQELAQKTWGEMPDYVLLSSEGPDHAKVFTVAVRLLGKTYGKGKGQSKKEAEKAAARDAIQRLKQPTAEPTED